jgi:hypothetical protein
VGTEDYTIFRGTSLLKTRFVGRFSEKNVVMRHARLATKNVCAGEGQE